eukprot:1619894-Pyramimonas_sp.AAC.1
MHSSQQEGKRKDGGTQACKAVKSPTTLHRTDWRNTVDRALTEARAQACWKRWITWLRNTGKSCVMAQWM